MPERRKLLLAQALIYRSVIGAHFSERFHLFDSLSSLMCVCCCSQFYSLCFDTIINSSDCKNWFFCLCAFNALWKVSICTNVSIFQFFSEIKKIFFWVTLITLQLFFLIVKGQLVFFLDESPSLVFCSLPILSYQSLSFWWTMKIDWSSKQPQLTCRIGQDWVSMLAETTLRVNKWLIPILNSFLPGDICNN